MKERILIISIFITLTGLTHLAAKPTNKETDFRLSYTENMPSRLFEQSAMETDNANFEFTENNTICDDEDPSIQLLNLSRYVSCPGASITLTMDNVAGTTYYWYHQKSGGNVLSASSPSNTYTLTTNTLPDTFWVEPRVGGNPLPRIPIIIHKSSVCGSSVPQGCLEGSLLYSQDFGGNDHSSPRNSPTGLAEISSDLNYSQAGSQGHYTLTKNPGHMWNGYYHTDDHTFFPDTTRGYMMYVDPAQNQLNAVLFSTTIRKLCDGMKLSFSAWFVNANNYTQGKPVAPKIKMQILNKFDNSVIVTMGTIEILKGNLWKQYGFDFLLPTGVDSVTFRIINMENSTTGNDLGIDDIEIRFCAPPVTIDLLDLIEKCVGENLVFDGSYIDNGTFGNNINYRWEYSKTGNVFNSSEWSVVSGSAGSTVLSDTVLSSITINSLAWSDTGYYRLVVGTDASIDLWSCRAVSKAIRLKLKPRLDAGQVSAPNAICVGDTITMNKTINNGTWQSFTPEIASIDEFTGKLVGLRNGNAIIVYTLIDTNGCPNIAVGQVIINSSPAVSITGMSDICVGTTTQLSPAGNWTSIDPDIATVTNTGLVTGINEGSARFVFTSLDGCTDTTALIWVDTFPKIEDIKITADKNILCTNSIIEFSCTINNGIWRLSNENALIYGSPNDNPIIIKGNTAGNTTIYYTVGKGACKSTSDFLLKVVSTVNPQIRIGIQR